MQHRLLHAGTAWWRKGIDDRPMVTSISATKAKLFMGEEPRLALEHNDASFQSANHRFAS